MSCEPGEFFLLRTPLSGFDRWWSWTHAGGEEALRAGLRDALTPAFLEAVYVASPDLYAALEGWARDPHNRRSRAVESALVAYFSRSADRATPFGLFAGITTGAVRDISNLELPKQSEYRKRIRLDLRYIAALGDDLEVEERSRYRPNSTIFRMPGKIRYLESRIEQDTGFKNFSVVDCRLTEALDVALQGAQGGAQRETITRSLTALGGNDEEVDTFFRALVDAQLLVADSACVISGDDPSFRIASELGVQQGIAALEQEELGSSAESYQEIERQLSSPNNGNTPKFFVDLLKPSPACSLAKSVVNEIRDGLELVRKIARPEPDLLAHFKQAFVERYGSNEVPLLEALDEEAGISITRFRRDTEKEILKGVFRPGLGLEASTWTDYDQNLLRVIAPSLNAELQSVEVEARDIEALSAKTPPVWPDLFAVTARLFARSTDALDGGDFRYALMGYLAGPALLGRFASIDVGLRCQLQHWLNREIGARPDCLFAEIVHVPQGEPLGQIICRPSFYPYQIPVAASSSVGEEFRIELSDLKVSVSADRVLLRSERLDREVIPKLPIAHNFRKGTNLQLYRFLCELQYQGQTASAVWTWPPAMRQLPFLPRLTHSRMILSFARWRIEREEIAELCAIDPARLFAKVNTWRNDRRMPRFVRLLESDYHIPIDFENILSVRCMLRSIRRSAFVYVEEMPFVHELCVTSGTERFQHEITLPFVAREIPVRPAKKRNINTRTAFAPGSEWVYLKIYCSPKQIDDLLKEQAAQLLSTAKQNDLLELWFFVRYADPESHLRLRLKARPGSEADLLICVQNCVRSWIETGLCWRIQFDTYMPEAERYGGSAAIALAEQIFYADSEAVLQMIRRKPRWLLAMLGIDALLNDFGLPLTEKLQWATEVRDAFRREFGSNVDPKAIGVNYRTNRSLIRQAFGNPTLFAARSERVRALAAELGNTGCGGFQTIAHYTHMHVNRVMRSNQRQHESVLCDFLTRWYRERLATTGKAPDAD